MDLQDALHVQGRSVALVNAPRSFDLPLGDASTAQDPDRADCVLAFARNEHQLQHVGPVVAQAAADDRVALLAYPRQGRLDTDLDREALWKKLAHEGVRPADEVEIDETWTALRLRPTDAP